MTSEAHLELPRLERTGQRVRVVADIDSHPLWFESDDISLRPRPEAFASAVLPGVMESRRMLVSDGSLSRRWRRGVAEIASVGAQWWDWGPAVVQAPVRWEVPRRLRSLPFRRPRTALAFSGGVDSFHALLAGDLPIDVLVSVHGFDIALDDTARMARWEIALRQIAREVRLPSALVRTNVREHPTAVVSAWPRAHGGALAALGHALGGVSRFVIASSYPRVLPDPWGSHWRLDPHWSSERLQVCHVGDTHWRADKLREISEHPVVRRYLRVCWEHRREDLNCGRCEKCVRTQLVLAAQGQLDQFSVFPRDAPLADLVDDLDQIETQGLLWVYEDLARRLPEPLGAALRRLIERSPDARSVR